MVQNQLPVNSTVLLPSPVIGRHEFEEEKRKNTNIVDGRFDIDVSTLRWNFGKKNERNSSLSTNCRLARHVLYRRKLTAFEWSKSSQFIGVRLLAKLLLGFETHRPDSNHFRSSALSRKCFTALQIYWQIINSLAEVRRGKCAPEMHFRTSNELIFSFERTKEVLSVSHFLSGYGCCSFSALFAPQTRAPPCSDVSLWFKVLNKISI